MIPPWVGSGLDGDEPVPALRIGLAASGAGKVRIQRSRVLVLLVQVPPGGIRLPDFHHRVRDRPAVAVEHAAGDDDALSDRLAGVLPRQVKRTVSAWTRKARRRKIEESIGKLHQRLERRA